MAGPLQGLRVIEMAGIGPGPFCAMLFADMGAEVVRIERPGTRTAPHDILARGRSTLQIDLRAEGAAWNVLDAIAKADVLIEGFRPGVMERLGLGPAECHARNPRLVYGRMTGWGQQGPLAERAGHDINYIALSGVLHAMGRPGQPPAPPLNLVGDFGGGGMMLAFGIACAVIEARTSGRGQTIDAAMVDGAATLATMFGGMLATGAWTEARGANVLDGGAPWYDTYETRDGRFVAIGAIEPKFYRELLERLGLAAAALPDQQDRAGWPALRAAFTRTFASRTRDEWCAVFEGSDACFAPVLTFSEARAHPHAQARSAFQRVGAVDQPAPAPRFDRTPGRTRRPPPERGEGGRDALQDWGFDAAQITQLAALGVGMAAAGAAAPAGSAA